jgi:hypothetical protein
LAIQFIKGNLAVEIAIDRAKALSGRSRHGRLICSLLGLQLAGKSRRVSVRLIAFSKTLARFRRTRFQGKHCKLSANV